VRRSIRHAAQLRSNEGSRTVTSSIAGRRRHMVHKSGAPWPYRSVRGCLRSTGYSPMAHMTITGASAAKNTLDLSFVVVKAASS
jgi:hypothetical protein